MRVLWILAALMLAGCTAPTLDDDTYTLEVHDAPSTAQGSFMFHLHVDGEQDHTSDHIGAHYWNQSVSDPAAAFGDASSCEHQEGDVPGEFEVTCDLEPGTWYVRGHMRITEDGTDHNYWSDEFAVEVSSA